MLPLPFQEGRGEMSLKQHNLILPSLQFRENYQSPVRRIAVRLSDTILRLFLLCIRKNGGNFFHLDSRIVLPRQEDA